MKTWILIGLIFGFVIFYGVVASYLNRRDKGEDREINEPDSNLSDSKHGHNWYKARKKDK